MTAKVKRHIRTPLPTLAVTAKKAASTAAKPKPKKAAAQKAWDQAQEHSSLLHESLAIGASAAAKAIRDAHKPQPRTGSARTLPSRPRA